MSARVCCTALLAGALMASCSRSSGSGSCTAESDRELCAAAGVSCGPMTLRDRCDANRNVDCGSCTGGAICGANHRCACESDRDLCQRLAGECGEMAGVDSCGIARTADCGACPGNGVCGGAGVPNQCASCQGPSEGYLCASAGAACGTLAVVDRCGTDRRARCGDCAAGQTCGALAPNQCGPQICEDDGFCWVSPLPQGKPLQGVWVASAHEAWAVGVGGTILHGTDSGWTKVASPTQADLNAMWGSGENDIWAVGGGGAIVHWDGTAWQAVASPATGAFTDIDGIGPNDVRACTQDGKVLRWDGTAWAVETSVGSKHWFKSIWVRSSTDYEVGDYYGAMEWNGTSLEPVDGLPSNRALTVWGALSTDGWAWERDPSLYHWDGSYWEWTVNPCPDDGAITTIRGAAANDVWAVCELGQWAHWDGSQWAVVPGPGFMATALHGQSGSSVIAVGKGGRMARFDGTRWIPIGSRVDGGEYRNVTGIWGNDAGELWAVGPPEGISPQRSRVLRWDGSAWSPFGPDISDRPRNIWGTNAGELWVGDYRWNGSSWANTSVQYASSVHDEIWGTSATDVWGCHDFGIDHWDGSAWTPVSREFMTACLELHGLAANDVWALAVHDAWHWDGGSWSVLPLPSYGYGLWGAAPNDVWIAGSPDSTSSGAGSDRGVILHWNGEHWSQWTTTEQSLRSICGRRADDVWIVGEEIAHWDGRAWSERAFGTDLSRCWVERDGTVWAVGMYGAILRRAGR